MWEYNNDQLWISQCQAFINELSASHSTDLQQRAYEIQALLGFDANTLSAVLPTDASCEDIEVTIWLNMYAYLCGECSLY